MSSTNGNNSRLDRIEKLIEQGELANRKAHERLERAQDRLEKAQDRTEKTQERQGKAQGSLDRDLRRWAALGVQEARSQRKRSAELDKKIGQLAAAQLVTEEKQQLLQTTLTRFIDSMERGRNGH